MFDIGFWELVVIAVVALLVVGPERLPQLARDASRWLRSARRFLSETRWQIEREFDLEEDRGLQRKISELDALMKQAPDRDRGASEDQR